MITQLTEPQAAMANSFHTHIMTRRALIAQLIEKYGEEAELPAVYAQLFSLAELQEMLTVHESLPAAEPALSSSC